MSLSRIAQLIAVTAFCLPASAQVEFKVGGRIHNDWSALSGDDDLKTAGHSFEDGNEFRRARLNVKGTIGDNLEFKVQYDFGGGDADFKDVYLGLKGLPGNGKFRVGHFKEPIGLEEQTSSNNLSFMERSLRNSLSPVRNTGFMYKGASDTKSMTYAAGIFRDTDSYGNSKGDGEYNVTARVTGTPIYEDGGAHLVHLGVAASLRSPNDDEVSYKDNRSMHLAPNLSEFTAGLTADEVTLFGLEAAYLSGPLSVQGEYTQSSVDDAADSSFGAYYLQFAYTLTGESRGYKTSDGVFESIKPSAAYGSGSGSGAWELVARHSAIDLSDGGGAALGGGEISSNTLGLNWYLNSNVRVMFNLDSTELEDVGTQEGLGVRFQVTF